MNPFKKLAREFYRPFKRAYQKRRDATLSLKLPAPPTYHQDGLICFHNTSFMQDPAFKDAYQRGIAAAGKDYTFHWRVHVALWAASYAATLEGDFVECGVNRGVLSSCVMQYLNWNSLHRKFYLFDTFCGFDPSQLRKDEEALDYMQKSKAYYSECYNEVKQNFSEFNNVFLVRGSIPNTLTEVPIDQVAYLSIDMNCANPEIAAAEHFWPKLAHGAMILLDDYAYGTTAIQQGAFDAFAKEKGTHVLSLPTGQGLILKH